jgi:serine phosphatase RsbU (regulator of sigma subunit)/anti-sigma regulatory factor (Ser/Thr protein kinase)
MKQSRVSGFFSPTIWLSGQLSFSRKYMLIGVVVLLALTSLSVPLLQQAREDSQFARLEREGLKLYVSQANALAALVTLRSQAVSDQSGQTSITPQALSASIDSLIVNARKAGMADHAERLERSWAQARNLDKQEEPQRRFAALTGSVNALLSLILQSARIHRLNVDPELDATFDMLANRLPLVLETLAKQQDALTLKTSEMASYALGAQVVLTESVPGLKAGIARLVAINPASAPLTQALTQFLARIAQQQDAADKTLDDPDAIDELRGLATSNVDIARKLLNDSVITADGYLLARIDRLQRSQWVIAGLLIVAISAIAYLFAGIYLSTLRSLKSLSEGTDAFCGGRLGTRIKIDTKDELVLVARNFNTMAKEFGGLLDVIHEQNESRERELETLVQARTSELAEKNEQLSAVGERVQEELNLARNMQLAILPQHFPDNAELSVHASMFPARELGGDFYDCFPLADGRYGVLVADVSGKGVGAAFFMAVSRTVLLDLAMTGDSPAQIFARANELLCERNPMELFVTACYAIYTPRDGQLIYASAGHHPPLARRFSGNVEALHCPMDIALGVMPGMTYSDHSTILKQGDTLLLYTDGVTEAFDAHNEAYGDARLHDWLAATAGDDAPSLIAGLVGNVAEFVGDAEASDDLTCLVLCRKQGAHDVDMPNTVELQNKILLLDYQMPSRLEEIATLAEAVEGVLPERQDLAFSANLCLEELITNTIQHGLNGASDRIINVRISISDEWLEIILKDDAPPFDPFAEAPLPDIDLAIDERPIGGLGVHMVKMMMDDARTYYDGSGNLIVLLKTLKR